MTPAGAGPEILPVLSGEMSVTSLDRAATLLKWPRIITHPHGLG
jgi:hypothetical protein